MTEQEVERHFKGYKWHHFMINFPAGVLAATGFVEKRPLIFICALVIVAGGILQGRYFFQGMKKFVQFIKQAFQNKIDEGNN